jgi:uncharacterized protein YlxP (DUF503 family)
VFVGVLKVALLCRDSHSLKEKRAVVRKIKDRVEQKFHVAVAEVGSLDAWQRAELGLALAASDRAYVGETLDRVIGFIRALGVADLIDDRRDVFAYGDDAVGWRGGDGSSGDGADDTLARAAARTGAGDKLVAEDDWVPPAWREEADS